MLKRRSISTAIIVALLGCCPSLHSVAAQSKRIAAKKPIEPPYPAGPAYTLENVIVLIQKVPAARVLQGLKKRGIDFTATPENMHRLTEANASPEVLDEIRLLSKDQETKAPPTPPKTGLTLLVTCVPAECEVRLNDKPHNTVKGEWKFSDLNPEAYKVTAWREGYEIEKEVVEMNTAKPGEVKRQDFELKPTVVRQGMWGDALLKAMLAKGSVSRDAKQIAGVLTIKEAQTVQWNLSARITAPGTAEIEMSNAQAHVNVSCVDGGCQIVAKKGSMFNRSAFRGSKQEQLLQENFLLRHTERWLANEYTSMILRLSGVRVNTTSKTDPESDKPKEFQAGINAGAYSITLDEDSRPKSVRFAAAAGLTGATIVTYANYQKGYPALTEIRFTDNEKQSLSFAAK